MQLKFQIEENQKSKKELSSKIEEVYHLKSELEEMKVKQGLLQN